MVSRSISNLYLAIVLTLVGIGVVMVFSASTVATSLDPKFSSDTFFASRHILFVFMGLLAAFVISRVDYHILVRIVKPLYTVTLLLLIAVIVMGVGANHAQRWLAIGPLKFQPSEIAKIAVVVSCAAFATLHKDKLESFKQGFLRACMFILPLAALIIIQPDLGTALFVVTLGFAVLVVGGLRVRQIIGVAAIALPIVIGVMFFAFDHVQSRIMVFLDPAADRLGAGHQIYQSLIAIGSGGWFGEGLGNSSQKLFFLPEEHTDFIFAILVEELGFLGGGLVIFLFAALVYVGARVSKHAPDRFGALLALGFTLAIALQAAMNIAVVTASVPTKGISLPFISFGGSGLIVSLAGVGVVLNVARQGITRGEVRMLHAREAADEAISDRLSTTTETIPGPGSSRRHAA